MVLSFLIFLEDDAHKDQRNLPSQKMIYFNQGINTFISITIYT